VSLGGWVSLPMRLPFSRTVPESLRAVHAFVAGYYAYLVGYPTGYAEMDDLLLKVRIAAAASPPPHTRLPPPQIYTYMHMHTRSAARAAPPSGTHMCRKCAIQPIS
jgi:hypothetical protein